MSIVSRPRLVSPSYERHGEKEELNLIMLRMKHIHTEGMCMYILIEREFTIYIY